MKEIFGINCSGALIMSSPCHYTIRHAFILPGINKSRGFYIRLSSQSRIMSWCAREWKRRWRWRHIHKVRWYILTSRLTRGCSCDAGCILGRIVDDRIKVRELCITWTWSLQVTILGVQKFSLPSRQLLYTPINVLAIIVLGVRKSPTITWLQLYRLIIILERRGICYIIAKLLDKLLVIIRSICRWLYELAVIRGRIK